MFKNRHNDIGNNFNNKPRAVTNSIFRLSLMLKVIFESQKGDEDRNVDEM
jgi:hypothetical protein